MITQSSTDLDFSAAFRGLFVVARAGRHFDHGIMKGLADSGARPARASIRRRAR